eukprot:TRINITY_DN14638_c0_g1_i1.p1 TRINITY_DN14638_c0_g1~~TRINITY_DN14638_c0_g1_i1.p1  ORF type:complete len:534 (+),score=83.18 TRINITY_DN14638_c0_g1_i1:155-1756(+)
MTMCVRVILVLLVLASSSNEGIPGLIAEASATQGGGIRDEHDPQTNFVVIFADDVGYGDFGLRMAPTTDTPNLNLMAQQGRTFTNWYSGAALCSPSRAALLTGRLPPRTGTGGVNGSVFWCNAVNGLPLNETTLAQLLGANDHYETGIVGKWHLGHREQFLPTMRGFNEYHGVPFSVDMGCPLGMQWACPVNGSDDTFVCSRYGLPWFDGVNITQQPTSLGNMTTREVSHAVSFIERNSELEKPFFLYYAPTHAHKSVTGTPQEQWAGPLFNGTQLRGRYGDAMAELDWAVGQIMTTLTTLNLTRNTLVWFVSDNGPWMPAGVQFLAGAPGPFEGRYAWSADNYTDTGKASSWEGGFRVPSIAWWPGVVPANTIQHGLASTMDVFTTILALAGVDPPSDRVIDGQNITDMLLGPTGSPSPNTFYFLWRGTKLMAVRCGEEGYSSYKAHYITKSGFGSDPFLYHNPPLLFNVDQDPAEAFSLNVADYTHVMDVIYAATKVHLASMHIAPDQTADQEWRYYPCCNGNWNYSNCDC